MSASHHHAHHDFASANQAHFDQHAHHADHRPMATELAESVYTAILQAYPFDQDATAVMDYACGTGIVSRRLAPHCKTLLGVDISQGMVDQFNKGVESDGIPSDKMHAVRAELKGEEPELEGATFDVVLCSLAYHHITDIAAVTRVLAFFLKPGGTLLVVDYPKMDTSTIPAEFVHIVAHQGISEAVIKDVYTGAGLGDFRCVFFKGPKAEQTDTPRMHPEDMFLALGVKI